MWRSRPSPRVGHDKRNSRSLRSPGRRGDRDDHGRLREGRHLPDSGRSTVAGRPQTTAAGPLTDMNQRARCRFLNSTTMLSATALPTLVGPWDSASPQKTWPALLFETCPPLPSRSDESVISTAQ